jgi:hypothetical protein
MAKEASDHTDKVQVGIDTEHLSMTSLLIDIPAI